MNKKDKFFISNIISFTKCNYPFRVFLINLLIACCIFLPFVVFNGGILTLCEDYNAETIPYRYLANQAVKSGEIFWNWNIDLGSDFIASFGTVGLFSPFFLVTLLLPRSLLLYSNVVLMILKFAVAGLGAAVYLRRYYRSKYCILIGSILYAFSGFHACIIVFDMLADASVFFPFLLNSMDQMLEDGKKGRFAFWIFICCSGNFTAFVGEVIFLLIYFFFRYNCEFKKWIYNIFLCIKEGILGILMASLAILPQIYVLLKDSRAASKLLGQNALTFSTTDIVLILRALLFPAESMSASSSIVETDWMTTALYIPMFGISLVIIFLIYYKNIWLKKLLTIMLFFLIIPALNNLFMLETGTPYHRWYYMFILLAVLSSMLILENYRLYTIFRIGNILLFVMFAYTVSMLVIPWSMEGTAPIYKPERFIVGILLGIIGIIISMFLFYKKESINFFKNTLLGVIGFAIITNIMMCYEYKSLSAHPAGTNNTTQEVYNEIINTGIPVKRLIPKVFPYRTVFWEVYHNYNMVYSFPCRTSFFSVINSSINTLYESLGTPRTTAMTPWGPTGTGELLSTKYYILDHEDPNLHLLGKYNNGNQMIYYYEDLEALPLCFTYDTYITKSEFLQLDPSIRAVAMLASLVIEDEQEKEVQGILQHSTESFSPENTAYDAVNYKRSHLNEVGTDFFYTSRTFGLQIHIDNEKYMFCSVPYSDFWSVSVNGQTENILNINGLMAIPVNAGNNEVVFTYTPWPTFLGGGLSLSFLVVWCLWMILNKRKENNVRLVSGIEYK